MRLRQRAKSIKIPIKRTGGGIQKPYLNVSYTEKKIEYMPKKDKQTWYNAVKDIYYQKLFSFILDLLLDVYTDSCTDINKKYFISVKNKLWYYSIAEYLERHYELEQTFLFRQIEQLINKSKKEFQCTFKESINYVLNRKRGILDRIKEKMFS